VRWIKNKSIAEMIINPLAERLTEQYDISVKGGALVQEVLLSPDRKRVTGLRYKVQNNPK
jgi:hypothetical protein